MTSILNRRQIQDLCELLQQLAVSYGSPSESDTASATKPSLSRDQERVARIVMSIASNTLARAKAQIQTRDILAEDAFNELLLRAFHDCTNEHLRSLKPDQKAEEEALLYEEYTDKVDKERGQSGCANVPAVSVVMLSLAIQSSTLVSAYLAEVQRDEGRSPG